MSTRHSSSALAAAPLAILALGGATAPAQVAGFTRDGAPSPRVAHERLSSVTGGSAC